MTPSRKSYSQQLAEAADELNEWVRAYKCVSCGLTIPENHWTGPWDERVLESGYDAAPGCPLCIYEAPGMVSVLVATRDRRVICGVMPLIPMADGSGCALPAGHDGNHSWAVGS